MKAILSKFIHYFDPVDLSKGNIAKGILRFLGPIVLSLLFQQIYTLVDAMIVGQTLGQSEVAAVNNATNLIYLVIDFAIGCMSGFSVIVGNLVGAKKTEDLPRAILNQIYLCLIITALLTIGGIFAIDPLLGLIGIKANALDAAQESLYENARIYLLIIFGGAVTQVFYNHIVSTLRALGDSFTPFCFLLGSTVLNIALDLLFIKAFSWGVAGAAFATVLAQGLAAFACYAYAFAKYKELRPKRADWKWDNSTIFESLKNGFPLGFSFSVLAIGLIVMQGAVDRFDITPDGIAIPSLPAQLGYGAGCKVINFLMAPLNGLGMAMLSFHSQNYGAKDLERIKKGFKSSMAIGAVLYMIVAAIGLLLTINGAYQYLFLSPDKVTEASIEYGNMYLFVAVPNLVFLMALFVLRNTLQGLELPLWTLLSGVGELLARVLVCLFLPYVLNGFAPTTAASSLTAFSGACLGDPMAWVVACLIMVAPCLLSIFGKGKNIFDKGRKKSKSPAINE